MMFDIKTLKLVIWDLDDTFWTGTLSEGEVILAEENLSLVKDLTDCGVMNSICSKNDFEQVKSFLQKNGIWDYFVFPSINWDSKGEQIVDKLDKMALRPVNVLFLDDNASNLGEVRHYLPTIQVGGPSMIEELKHQLPLLEKKDLQHKRLNQYKILETKDRESKSYTSNEEFLYDSQIQVGIFKNCMDEIQRIHELLMRSNQLNFTKKRISITELESVLKDSSRDCGYIKVKDRFGDYGIVGFYALKEGELEHFFFSCRTMGQKIEQWVYAQLGFPAIKTEGEVRTQLNTTECPGWIINGYDHTETPCPQPDAAAGSCKVLLKGPCDMSHSQVYIKNSALFETEFTYVNEDNGQLIDAYNHSVHIEGLHAYSEEQKKEIVQDCLFVDPKMLTGSFFTGGYDVIFLSTLIESTYQIYRKKGSDIRVVFGGNDLTNPDCWNGYISGEVFNGRNVFTRPYLASFAEKYECIGKTTPEMYIGFLGKCLAWLPPKTTLCLILGATRVYDGTENEVKEEHRLLNEAVKNYSQGNDRIQFIELDDCIHDSSDFAGGINHFSARVYFELAQKMISVIRQVTGSEVKSYSRSIVLLDRVIMKCRTVLKRLFNQQTKSYQLLKRVYDSIYKQRD